MFNCELAAVMEMVDTVTHPTMGEVKISSHPVSYRSSKPFTQPPPLLGQHTRNVLKYDQELIQRLFDDKVVI